MVDGCFGKNQNQIKKQTKSKHQIKSNQPSCVDLHQSG